MGSWRRMTTADIPLVLAWHKQAHVAEWWEDEGEAVSDESRAAELNKYLAHPKFELYILQWDGIDIGYLQAYEVYQLAGDVYGVDGLTGVWATDQFIGSPDHIDRGIGSTLIKQFTDDLLAREGIATVLTDPEPENERAVRAYQRAGFIGLGGHLTGEGAVLLYKGVAPKTKPPIPMPEEGDVLD